MLRLLRQNVEELELTASTEDFDAGIELTEAFLRTQTADVEILNTSVAGGTLTVDVRITNKAGHKFPTSFPSRRAWLHLTVSDGAGAVVFAGVREEGGTALAEAMQRGAPVIVFANGGAKTVAEAAIDHKRVRLVAPGSRDEIALDCFRRRRHLTASASRRLLAADDRSRRTRSMVIAEQSGPPSWKATR